MAKSKGGRWDGMIAELRDTMSNADMARHLGIPLGTVSSTIRRLDGKLDLRIRSARERPDRTKPNPFSHIVHQNWSERALTETRAERKARRAWEKQQREITHGQDH